MQELKVISILYFFLTVSLLCASERKPNFLLILADDLGYGDVSYNGGTVKTPHIDSIAKNGVILTNGYVTCPVCAPSRAGLLTGRYQQSFGFWDNIGPYQISKDITPGIPLDVSIISERLKELGYVTGIFGKTHEGDAEEMMAFNRWDEFYGFNNGASNFLGDMNRSNNPIFHNKKIVSSPYLKRGMKHNDVCRNGIIVKDVENHLTDKLGEMACKFIENNKDKPFLCYIPFNAVHGPFQAPKEIVEQFSYIKGKERRIVAAMLKSMDDNIGKVLSTLKKNGLADNTMIIFLSDNGGHEASPCKPFKGKKGTYWEGGLRVPFCMQWNKKITAGTTFDKPIISLDIMPTILKAAGAEIKSEWKLDGVDLLPYVTGSKKSDPHEVLYWVWGNKKAIRQGNFKALSTDDGKSFSLYDLSKDLNENNNLASNFPEILHSMVKKHQNWESKLSPQKWGWNSRLGYKNPNFGKPQPYHNPDYKIK